MSLCLTTEIEQVAAQVTRRSQSLFNADLSSNRSDLIETIANRRILVVGGAGSIGAATIMALVAYRPAVLAILDTSENNGVELVRQLRAGRDPFNGDLLLQPLDYGSPLAAAWLAAQPPFDVVLSFAAIKHVRSERDPWSILRMIEVNLLAADRFLAACRCHGHGRLGVFLVSTDKAAHPVSLMGASKRIMEHLLWWHAESGTTAGVNHPQAAQSLARVTTTRFANVAFSDGSLPWGFLQRLAKRQPLAAPSGIRRFLVSPREAGELCLLAALAPNACPHRHLLVPRLDPERDAVGFDTIAEALLAARGLRPRIYDDEDKARAAVESDFNAGYWPLLLTPPDTSGEKPMEEFVAAGERLDQQGLHSVGRIAAPKSVAGPQLATLFAHCSAWVNGTRQLPDKAALVAAFSELIPDLMHSETGRSLDGRM